MSPREMYFPTREPANKVLVLMVVVGKRPAHLGFAAEPLRAAIAFYLPRLALLSPQDHWKPIPGGHLQ